VELDFKQLGPMPMHYDNRLLSLLLKIMYSIKEPSTLRLIVISSEMFGPRRLFFSSPFFEAVSISSYQSCLTPDIF